VPGAGEQAKLKVLTAMPEKSCKESLYQKAYIELKGIENFFFDINEKKLTFNIDRVDYHFPFLNSKIPMLNTIALSHGKYRKEIEEPESCYEVDANCKVVKNNCDQCPNGFFEIIDSNCPGGGTRYCGSQLCGVKGDYACYRGKRYSGYTLDYCVNDSPVGFCNKLYRIRCLGKKLICE
jgi:hypothetical protein